MNFGNNKNKNHFKSTLLDIGVEDERDKRGISKMSTTLEYCPLVLVAPPPKNILFVDDVDARRERG
jgi:hypothetical protein